MNIARVQNAMRKRAGAVEEAIMDHVYNWIPIAGAANDIGGLAGIVRDKATEGEEEEWDNDKTFGSYVPGVNAYRLNKRLKRQTTDDKGGNPHFWSSKFGWLTSGALLAALGALGGGALGYASGNSPRDKTLGSVAGGLSGAVGGASIAGLMNLGGMLGAGMTDTRTPEEQRAYANSSTAAEWLVPGFSSYNRWKSIGRSAADSDERDEKRRKAKELAIA